MMVLSQITAVEVKNDRGVLVLTNQNFDEQILSHQYIFVQFYIPWR